MKYREMTIADYDAVISLWQKIDGIGLRGADSREGIDRYLKRNPALSFVVESDDLVVGTIMAGHDGKRGYIQHLAVSPECRKAGVGSRLHDLCMTALEEQGIQKSHIQVYVDNQIAKSFWSKRGWKLRTDIDTYSYISGTDENV